MKKQKSSYLQMQLEEASLESGRYNSDFAAQSPTPLGPAALLEAFHNTAVRLGADFNTPPAGSLAAAGLRRNGQN